MIHRTFENLSNSKREKILAAAKREFLNCSFEKSSINRILQDADIPKGSFYQYFDRKEDLFYACIISVTEKLLKIRLEKNETLLGAGLERIHTLGYEEGTNTYMEDVKEILTQEDLDLYQRLIDSPANVRNYLMMEIASQQIAPEIRKELEGSRLPEDTDIDYLAYLLSMSEVLAMDYGVRKNKDSIAMLEYSYIYMDALLKGIRK